MYIYGIREHIKSKVIDATLEQDIQNQFSIMANMKEIKDPNLHEDYRTWEETWSNCNILNIGNGQKGCFPTDPNRIFFRRNAQDSQSLLGINSKNQKHEKTFLIKIGRSKKHPKERIARQSSLNKEMYCNLLSFFSIFHEYTEWLVHKYFRKNRVVRPEIEDGKTEWFLVSARELAVGVWKIRQAMIYLYGDVGFFDIRHEKPP